MNLPFNNTIKIITESQANPTTKKPQRFTPNPIKINLNDEEVNNSSLLMMDSINEDNDNNNNKYNFFNKYLNDNNNNINNPHSLSVSPLSSLNASPLHSIRNNDTAMTVEEEDDDDILPTDKYPSLAPKYTNDSITTSNLSIGSGRSSANSQFGQILPNTANTINTPSTFYSFTSLKCKNDTFISSKLIYDNMDKYQSQNAAQNINLNDNMDDSFKMIDDEDEDDEDYYVSDYDEDEEEEEDDGIDHLQFIQDMDAENDGELETDLNAPTINISSLTGSQSMETCYDECGDHDLRIPSEFRMLNLNLSINDNGEEATATTADMGSYNLSNLYSKHSDDEEIDINNFNKKNKKKKIKKKKKKNKKIKKKIKKYRPPKHIQQKIDIHKEIKRLLSTSTSTKTTETSTNTTNSNTKRIKNNHRNKKKRKSTQPNMKSFQFNVESPMEYSNDNMSFHSFNSFHTDPPSKDSVSDQKKFDFSVPPNEIRLSEQACQHLVNLVEYQTGDEMD